jgi:hypothetical protein
MQYLVVISAGAKVLLAVSTLLRGSQQDWYATTPAGNQAVNLLTVLRAEPLNGRFMPRNQW